MPPASSPNNRLIGIACMMLAASILPVMNGLVQVLSPRYSSEQLIWARSLSHLIFIVALFAPRHGLGFVLTKKPAAQIWRSILLLASTSLFFHGVKQLPLAKAASISFTAPLIVAMLAWPVLGERITMARAIAVVVGFTGVLIVIRPGSDVFQWASLLILGSATCYAFYQLLTRRVAGHDPPETSAVYSVLVGSIVMTAVVPFTWRTPIDLSDATMMSSLGILGGLGHYFVARAMVYAAASVVTPFQYWQMVGSVIVGYVVSGTLPDAFTWLGAAVIISAGLFILWQETRKPKPV